MVRPKYIISKWKVGLGLLFWTRNWHRFHSDNKTIEREWELLVPFIFWSLSDKETKKPQDKFEIKVVDKKIMKVLGPLDTKHDFYGYLNFDDYDTPMDEAYSGVYGCGM